MKFSLAIVALATAASAATAGASSGSQVSSLKDFLQGKLPSQFLDLASEIVNIKGKDLPTQAECVAPIVGREVNSLSCNGKGPLSVLCGGIDEAASKIMPKIEKCHVKESLSNAVVEAAKEACRLGEKVVYKGEKSNYY